MTTSTTEHPHFWQALAAADPIGVTGTPRPNPGPLLPETRDFLRILAAEVYRTDSFGTQRDQDRP